MAIGIRDESTTGNPYIDPLLSGWKWDGGPVSYGFAQSLAAYENPENYYGNFPLDHFRPLSSMSVAAYQGLLTGDGSLAGTSMVLTPVSGFTNLTFTQTDPATTHTDMRFASGRINADYYEGFYPGQYASNSGADGDVWIGLTGSHGAAFKLQNPVNGGWGYYSHMWALGQGLGLSPSDMDIPQDKDFMEYTVMTWNRGPTIEIPRADAIKSGMEGGKPEIQNLNYYYNQTYMMLDIAALQQMYGANYTFRSDNNTYSWSPTTGAVYVDGTLNGMAGDGLTDHEKANKILQTLWDGGGIDTYDLSNYSANLKLNLAPGEYSTFSEAQRVYIGQDANNENWYARGNVYNALLYHDDPRSLIENARGGSGNDAIIGNSAANQLWGNSGNDTFTGGAGNDVLDGGAGNDIAVFSGAKADYTITQVADGSFTVTDTRPNRDGEDVLVNVDLARFSDQTVTLVPSAQSLAPIVNTPVVYSGTAGANDVLGGTGRDRLYGGSGDDKLNGLEDNDRLVGGAGKDAFIFTTELGTSKSDRQVNFDTIADFAVKQDKMWLDNAVFKKLGMAGGTLKEAFFTVGSKAKDKNDHLIYNQKTGVLSYDADGSGAKSKPVEFAQIKKNLALKYDHFLIV